MAPPILTIGYQGAAADALVAALRDAGVVTLIDVRAVPWSRRPEFAKKRLSERLEAAGIDYLGLVDLGSPEAARKAARGGDGAGFERLFAAHLAGERAQAALARAAERAARETVCLLCYEADPAHCHRTPVAEALAARTRGSVRHLLVGPGSTKSAR